MQNPEEYRQAICSARKSSQVVQFITADKFTPEIQNLMDNGMIYGAHFEKNNVLAVVDREGKKYYNVLTDGSHARSKKATSR